MQIDVDVRAHAAPWRNSIECFIRGSSGREAVRLGVVSFEDMPEPGVLPTPSFSLSQRDAQVLMDDLWNCGLRPTEGTGSAGAMAAQSAHLKDLQRLLFEDDRTRMLIHMNAPAPTMGQAVL